MSWPFIRYRPPLAFPNISAGLYSDGSGFWGGLTFSTDGRLRRTTSTSQFVDTGGILATVDRDNNFVEDYEIFCTVVSGTRDSRSNISAGSWVRPQGSFFLDISGGTFTVELRESGGTTLLTSTVTVA